MPATVTQRSVKDILDELTLLVQSVKLTGPDGEPGPEPAFQAVYVTDAEDLYGAFKELLISQQRVCLIIAGGETYETVSRDELLFWRRELELSLVFTDRVIGARLAALYGDAGKGERKPNPGAHTLKDLVIPAVCGELFENPGGVIVEPRSCDPLTVAASPETNDAKLKGLPGRAAVVLRLLCRGGTIEATQSSPGPIV